MGTSKHGKGLAKTGIVATVSLLAYPLCEWLSYTSEMDDPWLVFLAGIFFCFVCISAFCFVLLKVFPPDLPNGLDCMFFYTFSVFAFSAVVDLLIGMTLDGFIESVHFYLHNGEPYLKSSYGSFINWWDGTFHYALYLLMTYQLAAGEGTLRQRTRYTGLVWVGSIMNSLIVFLPGNLCGKFAPEVKWSYLLNVPYVLFPLLFAVRAFDTSGARKVKAARRTAARSPLDYAILVLSTAAVPLCFFRFFAAVGSPGPYAQDWVFHVEPYLRDPTLYPLLQCIAYVVYFAPFFIAATYCLVFPPIDPETYTTLADWSAICFGAMLQAQFSFVGPSLHMIPTYPEPTWRPVPAEGWTSFLVAQALLTLLPALLFLRYKSIDATLFPPGRSKKA